MKSRDSVSSRPVDVFFIAAAERNSGAHVSGKPELGLDADFWVADHEIIPKPAKSRSDTSSDLSRIDFWK